ncbi:hypothetical protein Tco_1374005 [Tanacetum coccineum]
MTPTHLDKECPLNEEVKQVEEAKYREFGHPALFNGSNEAKYRVGPPGFYTRIVNRPPYREKRPSLEELMNKYQEESVVNDDHETPSELNNLHEVSFIHDSEEGTTEVLQCKLPPKEQNLRISHFPALLVIDCFEEALDPDKDPRERSFDDYKWVFDLEIE